MAPLSLPYFANDQTLSATLPTVHEIESSVEVFSETTRRKVVGVGTHYVVKYGVQVLLFEGETQLFVAQSTLIPAPMIYALFQKPATDTTATTTYIVMERINGPTLEQVWPRLDSAAKETIAFQLKTIVGDMRKLPSPGRYCGVGNQALPDGVFWTADPSHPYAGPFGTEAELNEATLQKYI
jgi:hypothetical protein